MIWYYVVNWWNTSNPVRWISNAVWLQAAILQNCGLHMAIHIWLQSFRIRHPFWRPQNRGRHWSHACSWATWKILMNKKGAMVRDSYSLQSSCKADAALVDHVRLRSCFLSPSIPVAPNARFSVPPMHVTGRTRGESNPTVTQLPPGTSASKSTTVATLFSWGSASKWSVLKRPPFSLRSQRATSAKLDSWLS